jgi:hypothetical protein
MRRREFIALLAGTAAWPLGANAQSERVRRIGLLGLDASDPIGQLEIKALKQGLQKLGWVEGRNVQIEYRLPGGCLGVRRLMLTAFSEARSRPTCRCRHQPNTN